MKATDRIRDQLERAFSGNAWHGPSVMEILENVTASQAAERPIVGAHSIWELVLHIRAWEDACRRRLEGDRAELSDEEDWQPINDTSEAAWKNTLKSLKESHQRLGDAIAALDSARLDEPIIEGMPSIYITLHGVVQHDLYHAGQIAILKKASTGETI
ncbi:MAG TPA: DinB family protein [Pyrinomonadaceae bacterium]|nr:DinB family protein [Pyrinomonadaceae bacterium]